MLLRGKQFIFVVLCGIFVSGTVIPATIVWSEDNKQTIPTRTPVPPPTNTRASGGGGGSNPPAATNTPRPTVTPSLMPLNSGLEPCEAPSFVADLGVVNVRSGPGVNYPMIAQLEFTEIVPVSGRAQFAPWWQIELENNIQGWVADATGTVYGYVALANTVPIPDLPSGTPTPGPAWNPTLNPQCPTLTPTHTPLPATKTPIPATSTPSATATDIATPVSDEVAAVVVTATPTEEPTSDAMVTAAAVLTTAAEAGVPANETIAPTSLTSETAAASGRGLGGFLIIGFGLIVLGLVVASIRRAQK